MSKPRIDAPDTIELAHHWLLKMASEGWGIRRLDTEIDYAKPTKNGHRLPVGATVTISLIPGV